VNLHEDCQPSTMVEKQRPRSGSRFSLSPLTAAVLEATPPLGYKRPPTLIGPTSVPNAQRLLRAKTYAQAYKTTSLKDWNSYVIFGIQQFDSPAKYFSHCDAETHDAKNLRIARYYRLHLENSAPIDRALMAKISTVETALKVSHPGYFELSVGEMDEYVQQLSPDSMVLESHAVSSDPYTPDSGSQRNMTSVLPLSKAPPKSHTLTGAGNSTSTSPISRLPQALCSPSDKSNEVVASKTASPNNSRMHIEETSFISTSIAGDTAASSGCNPTTDTASTAPTGSNSTSQSTASKFTHNTTTKAPKIPTKLTNSLRVEVRWAPRDFKTLKGSSGLLFARLAPILSCFNTPHSWLVQWQTDQLATTKAIEPHQVAQFLSIRKVTSVKQQCFYFSFRLNATGSQFLQVLESKAKTSPLTRRLFLQSMVKLPILVIFCSKMLRQPIARTI
jgi:hypothetical protein